MKGLQKKYLYGKVFGRAESSVNEEKQPLSWDAVGVGLRGRALRGAAAEPGMPSSLPSLCPPLLVLCLVVQWILSPPTPAVNPKGFCRDF